MKRSDSSPWSMPVTVEGLPSLLRQRKRGQSRSQARKQHWVAYLFLLPWLAGLLLFTVGPMLASLFYSFTSYDLLSAPRWVGLDNYVRLFTQDERYLTALKVTFVYVFVSVPLKLAFSLLLAVLLSQRLRAVGLYRAVYYIPSLLGGSVAIAILWSRIFGSDGIVNQGLGLLGVKGLESWISSPNTALLTLIVLAVWQFGSSVLIFIAGLRQIPSELIDSAKLDGAGWLRRFFQITLPLLTPFLFFNLLLQMIGAFHMFTSALIVTNGGPADSTLFYTLYLYQMGFFGNYQMGYASAMAWILMLIILGLTSLLFFSARFWVFYLDGRH